MCESIGFIVQHHNNINFSFMKDNQELVSSEILYLFCPFLSKFSLMFEISYYIYFLDYSDGIHSLLADYEAGIETKPSMLMWRSLVWGKKGVWWQ